MNSNMKIENEMIKTKLMERVLDSRKIAFIMCVNNERYLNESLKYLNRLVIPDGYNVEMITVDNAKSMCEGYNRAMLMSDAKYKVYMHQDVFIVNPQFLNNCIDIFNDESVGMIGVVGSIEQPEYSVMWYGKRCGALYSCGINKSGIAMHLTPVTKDYQECYAIDGLLMMTSKDVLWNEDIFDGWDFYDISHSQDIRREGLKVVVPRQDTPWCLHDDGIVNLSKYFDYRERFENEYLNL